MTRYVDRTQPQFGARISGQTFAHIELCVRAASLQDGTMPRGMIRPRIWRNGKTGGLPRAGRLLFVGVWGSHRTKAPNWGQVDCTQRATAGSSLFWGDEAPADEAGSIGTDEGPTQRYWVARLLGLSRNLVHQGCLTGEMPSVRTAKRRLTPNTQLERMCSVKLGMASAELAVRELLRHV